MEGCIKGKRKGFQGAKRGHMKSSGVGTFMVACPLDTLLAFTTFTEYTINI
jgi:hypothetical protein